MGIIGVVAALTIPSLVAKFQRSIVENRLKNTYAVLANGIKLAEEEFGVGFNPLSDLQGSGYNKENAKKVFEQYFAPYIKINFRYKDDECVKLSESYSLVQNSQKYEDYNGACYALMNGVSIIFWAGKNAADKNYSMPLRVVINPTKKKKIEGRDVFAFRIISGNNGLYLGTIVKELDPNMKSEKLLEYCGNQSGRINILGGSWSRSNFCSELLMRNSWKIPVNYPVKF